MFHLTEEMLKVLMTLNKAEAWPVFLKEFEKIRDDNVSTVIHFDPPRGDLNARTRQDLFRGVAVCLDVLYNAFKDPASILEEIKLIEKTAELQRLADSP